MNKLVHLINNLDDNQLLILAFTSSSKRVNWISFDSTLAPSESYKESLPMSMPKEDIYIQYDPNCLIYMLDDLQDQEAEQSLLGADWGI